MAFRRAPKEEKEKKDSAIPIQSLAAARDVVFVPTGIVALDAMLGGGIPRGKIIEVFGPFKSGKTVLAMEAVRAFQQFDPGSDALWLDAEHALDKMFASRIGIDLGRLDYADDPNVNVAEYAIETIEEWTKKRRGKAAHIVVLDSLAALGTVHEFETEMAKRSLDRAGQLYKGFRRLVGPLSKHGVTFLMINQVRDKVGVFFGSPETTTGGKGPEFFASIRIRVSSGVLTEKKKIKMTDKGGAAYGAHLVIRCQKNRFVPEGQESEFQLRYLTGIDPIAGTLRLLADNGIIDGKRSADVFTYKGKVIDDAEAFVDKHPELLAKIWGQYRSSTTTSGATTESEE